MTFIDLYGVEMAYTITNDSSQYMYNESGVLTVHVCTITITNNR